MKTSNDRVAAPDPQAVPPLDKALIDALDRLFPESSPSRGEDHGSLMWRGGQRSVVRFLKARFDEQNENPISTQVL